MNALPEVKLLVLEDVQEEAELIERELRKFGLEFVMRRAQTRPDFTRALTEFAPDLILADAKLPTFDGRSALELVRVRCPHVPVIMVTGALGDEAAVEYLLAGARDYVLKDRLARLGSAVERALQQEKDRRARTAAVVERRRLKRALQDAAEDERSRLAKELHDGLGQELAGFALLADAFAKQLAQSRSPVAVELERLAEYARHAIQTCRNIARGLSPLEDIGGLVEALRDLTQRTAGPPGPNVLLTIELNAPIATSREACDHLYRIAQEALANAIKHSGAATVEVALRVDAESIRLSVIDDGNGMAMIPADYYGLGMKTMQNRAAGIGARLSVAARDGGGTAVMCELPQPQPASAAVS